MADPKAFRGYSGRSLGIAAGTYAPAWAENQIIYVGKHGLDTNTGQSIYDAMLTIQAAITQAQTDGAGAANRYTIFVLDAGNYDEALTLVAYVDVYAPNARLLKSTAAGVVITAVANTSVTCAFLDVITAQIGYFKNNAGDAWLKVLQAATAVGTGICVLNIAAGSNLYYTFAKMTVAGGFGVGDVVSNPEGHTHILGGGVYSGDTGTMFIVAANGAIRGRIDNVEKIQGTGTVINATAGTIELVIAGRCELDVMFLAGTGGEVHLYCPHFGGTMTLTGNALAEITGHATSTLTMSNTATCQFHGDIDGAVVMPDTAQLEVHGNIGGAFTNAVGNTLSHWGDIAGARTVVGFANYTHGVKYIRAAAGTGAITDADEVIQASGNGGANDQTLPTAIGRTGRRYDITCVDLTAAVRVLTVLGQTISGAANFPFAAQWDSITVESDGANWEIR